MSNKRVNRISEEIKKEVGDLLNKKLKDPRIGFVTVTDVEVTNDLQQATIFISVLGDEEEKESTLVGLTKASGFIRSEIGQRVQLRKTPEIKFSYDESLEYGNKIETILRELNEDE